MSKPEVPAMPQKAPATIVVAEDDASQREIFADLLTQAGFVVLQAADGTETLAAVREHRPDIAIIDVTMPDMSGWNVVRQLRDDFTLGGLRVIVVTGLTEAWNRDASIAAGADSHLTKPVRPDLLLAEINRVLGK